jgi:DNA-binding transcriptional LysR family regulator
MLELLSHQQMPQAPFRLAHHQLLPLVPGFLAEHPDVTLDVVLTDQVIDLLQERADISPHASARSSTISRGP